MLASHLFVVLWLCLAVLQIHLTLSDEFNDLLEKKRRAVKKVAVALSREMPLDAWCDTARCSSNEKCSPHGCSGGSFGDSYKCSNSLQLGDQAELCQNSDDPSGVLLNLDRAFIWTPEEAVSTDGNDKDIVVDDINMRRDVCALKKIEDEIIEAHKENNLTEWLYASTTSGAFSIYPGVPLSRPENSITRCGFNPVVRSWYITAASGTKDIVFLLDTTSLLTSSKNLLPALNETLRGLDGRDYFAIVAFGGGDGARVLGETGGLQAGTGTVTETLVEELVNLAPSSGLPNVTVAFTKAFDILEEAEGTPNSSGCSKLIVLLSGQDDECLAECAKSLTCECVEKLRSFINERQERLGDKKASIVSFTEDGSNNAERLARTIVCDETTQGIWRRVTDEDTKDDAMSTYSQIAAVSLFSEEPEVFGSESYVDVAGLGEIFTLAVAVYSNNEQLLVGVAGADITVKEVIDLVGEAEARAKIGSLSRRSRDCNRARARKSCELQALRSQKNSAICADILPASFECYRFGSTTYRAMREAVSWDEAGQKCAEMNGTLAKIDTNEKNKFIAGMVSADGSWIGMRAELGGGLGWEDGSRVVFEEFGFDWNAVTSAVQNQTNGAACVTVDRRGVEGNWNVEGCDRKRGYVCEVSAGAVDAVCGGKVYEETGAGEETVNDVNCPTLAGAVGRACSGEQDEEVEKANPVCKESGAEYNQRDRTCCGGKADKGARKGEEEVGVEETGGGLSTGAKIGIGVVVGIGGMLLVVGLVYGFWKYRAGGEGKGKAERVVGGDGAERGAAGNGEGGGNAGGAEGAGGEEDEDFASPFAVGGGGGGGGGDRGTGSWHTAGGDLSDYGV